jgi:hypothetical protein
MFTFFCFVYRVAQYNRMPGLWSLKSLPSIFRTPDSSLTISNSASLQTLQLYVSCKMMMVLRFLICWLCLSVRCALHEVTMLTLVSQGDARKNPFRLLFSARWLTIFTARLWDQPICSWVRVAASILRPSVGWFVIMYSKHTSVK